MYSLFDAEMTSLVVNGVDLAAFPNFTQESTAFVSILLPDNTRIFHWFEGPDTSDAIYGFVQRHLGPVTFSLIDRDIACPENRVVPPAVVVSKALKPINPGSTRNRFRLQVVPGPILS
jgi:hypothetical protein